MAITQDRFLKIIEAAEMYQKALARIEQCVNTPGATLADAQCELTTIAVTLNPHLIAAIELERRYFARFAKYNEREKIRQRRRKLGLPGGTGGHVGAHAKRPDESAQEYYAEVQAHTTRPQLRAEDIAAIQAEYDAQKQARTAQEQSPIHTPAPQSFPHSYLTGQKEDRDPNVISRQAEWQEGAVTPDQALKDLKDGGGLF